jgi:serine phosphatase RsbU (regulator of sigma subunit)
MVPGMTSQRLLRALPFIVLAIVTVMDLLAGPAVGFLSLLALGPTFASVSGSVRRTAAIGALALAISVALSVHFGVIGEWTSTLTYMTISGVTMASMLASHLRIRRERELANVRHVAEVAQRVLLRPVPRRAGDVRVALSYTSAAAEAQIGGDLYEVVTTPHGMRLLIGDVQGKGLDAVETAAWVLGAFREAAYDETELTAVGDRLEATVSERLSGERFVTAILGELRDGEMVLLNFGHPSPLMVRADGGTGFAEPVEEVLPLGLASLEQDGPKPYSTRFAPGDQILFYTDGLIEARDPEGRFYPLPERVLLLRGPDPQAALDHLRADLLDFVAGPLGDDAAMLLLRRHWTTSIGEQ